MKKSLITLGCGLLLMAGMTSCNSESMHTETNTTVLCSLVTGGDAANPSVTVTEGLYTFVMDYGESTMSVSTVGVDVDGTRYNVTTDPLKVTNIADQNHGSVLRISSPSAGLATGSGSLPVTDFGCSVYGYSIYELPNIAGIQSSPVLFQPIVIRYKIGDYLVRTFSSDCFFKGQTNTSFASQGGSMGMYQNTSTLYRVIMDVNKKTAQVIMYNVKFAEQMPEMKAMLLKGLTVTFDANGYTISGKDIIPTVLEGIMETPNDKYPFNSFVLTTADGELTSISCDFTVADRFYGSFTGSILPSVKQ